MNLHEIHSVSAGSKVVSQPQKNRVFVGYKL